MPVASVIGGPLDEIALGSTKFPAYRVLLFDPFGVDSFSDVVLNRYRQVPLDITPYVQSCEVTLSVEDESSQCSVSVFSDSLDYRLFMFAWIKVYEGDLRVDSDDWPCTFVGVIQGQPARGEERGTTAFFKNTAYDRSIFYRERRITSPDVWLPEDTVANLGEICVAVAVADWGMGLDRSEVLFGKFYQNASMVLGSGTGTGSTGLPITTSDEWRINKKMQIVDTPPMEALRTIMEVARLTPAFNGEGKLVARPLNPDRHPVRVYTDKTLIKNLNIPQNNLDLPTSVVVTGLDYRMTRTDFKYQKLLTVGPVSIGFFDPSISATLSYSEENEYRAVSDNFGTNLDIQGELLSVLFGFDSYFGVSVRRVDDFNCRVTIDFDGAVYAVVVVTIMIGVYIALKIVGAAAGQAGILGSILAWAMEATSTILLFLIMQVMVSLGTVTFEVWGTPFEYMYQELEAKAFLSDTLSYEDSPIERENLILGSLSDCEDLAQDILRWEVAKTANRSFTIATDQLLEPSDIIEAEEDGETARYFIMEIGKEFSRGADPTYSITAMRVR